MHETDIPVSLYSLQGEGSFVGTSVFRVLGCNFRCMNFGLPRDAPGAINKSKDLLDNGILDKAKVFDDLST